MSLSSLPHRTLSADQKRRLLAQILQQKAKQPATVALSVAQERLWFFEQFQEGSAVYNIFAPARLIGDLTISILERSLREVMLRHEALRTTFVLEDGIPVQRIVEEPALHLFVEDLLYLPEELREEEARRLALKDAQQPFDLQRGPLLRVLIVRLAEDEHLFLLNIHHIIADGWSSEIILRELSALYSAYTRGTELSLPAQAVQYSNFVHWQQKRGQVWVDHLEYWRHHLTGAQPLQLPVSQNRPPVMTYRGGRQWKRLPAEILTQLNRLSQQEGATLYMTVLSAFTILLARYSGTEDITVGTPAAGRSRQEFENVVGFFVNMLALRTNLTGVSSFLEVLRRTRQVVLD
nr:condensation protein [Ktedonobacteraceae bacterium]